MRRLSHRVPVLRAGSRGGQAGRALSQPLLGRLAERALLLTVVMLAVAFAALAVAFAVLAAPALASPVEERASSGQTEATFSYDEDDYEHSDLWLTVTRAGTVAYEQPVAVRGCEEPYCHPAGFGERESVKVADLDGDGEAEVLLDVFTGGAHCCFATRLLYWDGARYKSLQHGWGDPGYRLRDLDGDGVPELESADARFGYRFASFASSGMPVAVWSFDAGKLVDVTDFFPSVVRRDAARWLRAWRAVRSKPTGEPMGALAAWAANEYRLGHRAKVRRQLRVALRRGWLGVPKNSRRGAAFIRDLDGFLTRTGYRP